VETWSVFDKDKLSTRELTLKEAGKLLDLRPEWSQDIAEIVWNWNNSAPPHICLLAEVGISKHIGSKTMYQAYTMPIEILVVKECRG
jgi:hypothetical protein